MFTTLRKISFCNIYDKLLPNLFTKVHPKYLTPINTIFFTCIIMTLVILFLDIEKIDQTSNYFSKAMFIVLLIYVL